MINHPPRFITRRNIQIALGLLWLLDGALQLQHQMFSSAFANNVLASATNGQPLMVSGPMHAVIRLILQHPAVWNALFAGIQLVLGLLILYKPTARLGLRLSVGWALLVWYFGEGLGGLLGAQTSLLMGAPGAVILYAILALAVMPQPKNARPEAERPAYWLPLVWALLWVGGAIYQLLPGQNTTKDLSMMIFGNANGAPIWLAKLDIHAASILSRAGGGFMVWLVSVQLLIGLLILRRGQWRTVAVFGGIVLSLLFWVYGQSLGEYFTGLASDPNAAPLFILMGLAILSCQNMNLKLLWHKSLQNLEQYLT